jgi:hypothetical protein
MGQRHPAAPADSFQPDLVSRVRREMVGVPLNGETGRAENFSKLLAEIAIREPRDGQAARS